LLELSLKISKIAKKSRAATTKSNSNIHPFPIRQTGIKFDYQNFITTVKVDWIEDYLS
jgi:hypothetical protein